MKRHETDCPRRRRARGSGFTLIELLVVVSIIGVLIAVLLPAFGVVRTQAKKVDTKARFKALDMGIESFRGEAALGGQLPPSASDFAADTQMIANPTSTTPTLTPDMKISGAHLLFQALLGADHLGTPGFKDLNRNGIWADDTNASPAGGAGSVAGAYFVDQSTGLPAHSRYGGAGYVDDKLRTSARSLSQLLNEDVIVNWPAHGALVKSTGAQPFFTDAWGLPILYYRANRAALRMTGDGNDIPGVYHQWDNGIITGSTAGGVFGNEGIDFGAGEEDGRLHDLKVATYPPAVPVFNGGVNDVMINPDYEGSFARFILDPSIKARNTSARSDSYLLISAGPDARYGTSDDIVNWQREQD